MNTTNIKQNSANATLSFRKSDCSKSIFFEKICKNEYFNNKNIHPTELLEF